MNEICTLVTLELRSLYGINRFRYTKDKKAKNRYRLIAGILLLLLLMIFGYVGGLVWGLCEMNASSIVPMYLCVIASLLIFAFGIFTASNRIFGQKGYDLLASMPLRSRSIVISRFAVMYLEDILFTLIVFLPGVAVFAVQTQPDIGFYLLTLLCVPVIPAIPLVASVVVGTLIAAISSRMRRKSLVQSLLMIVFVVLILILPLTLQEEMPKDASVEMLFALAEVLGGLLARLYPPAAWFGAAALDLAYGKLILFFSVSLLSLLACVGVAARIFHPVLRVLSSISARHDYQLGMQQSKGILRALYLREAKRYFSSTVYVTNTITGPVMGCIASVALFFVGTDRIAAFLPINVNALIPFAVSGIFCMMNTTSTAISMEGKHFWVVKSLPVPTKTLLDAKILLNLSLILPFYLVSEIFLILTLRPDWLALVFLLLLPLLLILFSVVFGITVNLKLHSFDWEKEEQVVKQSASSALGGFAGMLLALLLGGVSVILPAQFFNCAQAAICILLIVGARLLYQSNNKIKLEQL